MTKIDNGGPAFPPHRNPETHASGMTLRDWFAGQALQGLAAGLNAQEEWHGWSSGEFAKEAFELADAMLKERGSS